MAFNTFSLPRVQNSFQFMPYGGPPEPKPPSQRPPSKFPASSEQGNKVDLVNVLGEIETVDLTNFTDNEGDVEISCNGVESGEVRDDDGSGASVLTSREDAGDEVSRQPVPHESCSQGTALVIDDSRSDLELDSDDLDDENAGLHQGDRLEFPSAPTIESYDEEVSVEGIDAIDSETADGEKTNASGPPHWRSSSTPPTSPSIMDIQEHRTEKRLEREAKLLSTGSTSRSSSGSDADDVDHNGKCTSLIRKRKRLPSANIASHKRQSQRPTSKASTDRTKHTARQWNPSLSQKKAISSRPSAPRYASGVQSSGDVSGDESSEESEYQTHNLQKGPKPIASNPSNIGSLCADDEEPSATHAPPHANRATWPSANWVSPVKAQWHLSDIIFHSLSADVSFLTALFRARGGSRILSASNAVELLDNVVGRSTKHFEPKSNNSMDQNFTPVVLTYTRLYCFTHLRLIAPLKALTLKKLYKTLIGFKLYTQRIGDIIELARYAYSNPDLPDGSADGHMDDLKKIVVEYIVCEIDLIGRCKEFVKYIEEGGEFVGDF